MQSRFLQVENTVTFLCFVIEVKSYIQFLFYADFILGLLVVLYQCVVQAFDVQNPQVPLDHSPGGIYSQVFLRVGRATHDDAHDHCQRQWTETQAV